MLKEKQNTKFLLIFIFFLVALNLFAWFVVFNLTKNHFLEINFLDVGQGDSIFIETPNNYQILIDGGPSPNDLIENLSKLMPFYDRSIDLIILTHPEKDHITGLLEVLKRYKIKNILWTGIIRDTSEWNEWNNLIKKEKSYIKIAKAGQKIIFNDLIYFTVLYPFEDLEGQIFNDSNDTSIVGKLVFKNNSFLFTGDIGKSVEKKLVDENIEIDSDVLKIAHHGSKNSTSTEFLEKVSPEIAVIQVGKNNYGHPNNEVLARLEQFDITILRNDKNGDIKIISLGNNLKIKTEK
ncbi:MAG: ComEC/Rec2 family competence protein [Candidatus Pacebacteria bacterium]|nr:ComEC/Rec2 family competence protein [Candidatus Paceibacterota bacterium]